jgi:signal transduction histidine kinase
MSAAAFDRHHIEVVLEHGNIPPVTLDRQKLLQILVNLIRNAKHAICDHSTTRRLTIRIGCETIGRILIEVIDTGRGIPPEDLTRIFAHGFTTKKNGHGFGLHSSALAAKAMGGTLQAHSEGIGFGARFSLDLPIQVEEQIA